MSVYACPTDDVIFTAHLDIDECANRQDNCSVNANCTNKPGMFECVCTDGHFGNGYICIGKYPNHL